MYLFLQILCIPIQMFEHWACQLQGLTRPVPAQENTRKVEKTRGNWRQSRKLEKTREDNSRKLEKFEKK